MEAPGAHRNRNNAQLLLLGGGRHRRNNNNGCGIMMPVQVCDCLGGIVEFLSRSKRIWCGCSSRRGRRRIGRWWCRWCHGSLTSALLVSLVMLIVSHGKENPILLCCRSFSYRNSSCRFVCPCAELSARISFVWCTKHNEAQVLLSLWKCQCNLSILLLQKFSNFLQMIFVSSWLHRIL
jgi:hypothetical protein